MLMLIGLLVTLPNQFVFTILFPLPRITSFLSFSFHALEIKVVAVPLYLVTSFVYLSPNLISLLTTFSTIREEEFPLSD